MERLKTGHFSFKVILEFQIELPGFTLDVMGPEGDGGGAGALVEQDLEDLEPGIGTGHGLGGRGRGDDHGLLSIHPNFESRRGSRLGSSVDEVGAVIEDGLGREVVSEFVLQFGDTSGKRG